MILHPQSNRSTFRNFSFFFSTLHPNFLNLSKILDLYLICIPILWLIINKGNEVEITPLLAYQMGHTHQMCTRISISVVLFLLSYKNSLVIYSQRDDAQTRFDSTINESKSSYFSSLLIISSPIRPSIRFYIYLRFILTLDLSNPIAFTTCSIKFTDASPCKW